MVELNQWDRRAVITNGSGVALISTGILDASVALATIGVMLCVMSLIFVSKRRNSHD